MQEDPRSAGEEEENLANEALFSVCDGSGKKGPQSQKLPSHLPGVLAFIGEARSGCGAPAQSRC